MNSYKDFLKRFPKTKLHLGKRHLLNSNNRANLFVSKIQNFIINELSRNNITLEAYGRKLGISKSAVSQMLNQNENIKISTLFKALDALEFTIELPVITKLDIEKICKEYESEHNLIDISDYENPITNNDRNTPKTHMRLYKSNDVSNYIKISDNFGSETIAHG